MTPRRIRIFKANTTEDLERQLVAFLASLQNESPEARQYLPQFQYQAVYEPPKTVYSVMVTMYG